MNLPRDGVKALKDILFKFKVINGRAACITYANEIVVNDVRPFSTAFAALKGNEIRALHKNESVESKSEEMKC